MFCRKCGSQIPDDSAFCFKCGAQVASAETEKKVGDSKLWEYTNAVKKMDTARTAEELEKLEKTFERLGDYKDSAEKLKECREKNISVLYSRTLRIIETAQDITDIQIAVKNLKHLGDYKDTKQLLEKCEFDLKLFQYNDAYKQSQAAETLKEISAARDVLLALGDFEDCPQLVKECEKRYSELALKKSDDLLERYYSKRVSVNEIADSMDKLRILGDDEAAQKKLDETKEKFAEAVYNGAVKIVLDAQQTFSDKKYREAAKLFKTIPGKKNSKELADLCDYNANVITFNLIINKLEVAKDEYAIENCRLDLLEIKDFEKAQEMIKECERMVQSITRFEELKKLILPISCSNDIDTLKATAKKALAMKNVGNAEQIAEECQRKIKCLENGEQFIQQIYVPSIMRGEILCLKAEIKTVQYFEKSKTLGIISGNEKVCRKCGKKNDDDSAFCRFCGAVIK